MLYGTPVTLLWAASKPTHGGEPFRQRVRRPGAFGVALTDDAPKRSGKGTTFASGTLSGRVRFMSRPAFPIHRSPDYPKGGGYTAKYT